MLVAQEDAPGRIPVYPVPYEYPDVDGIKEVLNRVRDVASGRENIMPVLIEAVKTYATVGEISDTLRDVFGEYRASEYFPARG